MCRPPLRCPESPPSEHERQRIVGMDVRVAHPAAPHDQRMIEERTVAVRRRLQLREELGDQLSVVHVRARIALDPLRLVLMVRQRVVRFVDADFRQHDVAQLARHHEGRDARDVRLERHGHQVVHHVDELAEFIRQRRWRCSYRRRGLALHLLDARLDLADILQVVVEAAPVGRAQAALQPLGLARHGVQHAAPVLQARGPLGGVTDCPAEHPIEDGPGTHFHRQRRRRRLPRNRVQIGAAEADFARPDFGREVLRHELERREERVLAVHLRQRLIDRLPGANVGALAPVGMHHAGEEHRGRQGVAASPLRTVAQIGDHDHLVLVGFERLQHRLQLEVRAGGLRSPRVHDHAVRREHAHEPSHRRGGCRR